MLDFHSQSCSPCVSSTSTSTLEKNSIGPRPLNRMRSSEFHCDAFLVIKSEIKQLFIFLCISYITLKLLLAEGLLIWMQRLFV